MREEKGSFKGGGKGRQMSACIVEVGGDCWEVKGLNRDENRETEKGKAGKGQLKPRLPGNAIRKAATLHENKLKKINRCQNIMYRM